MPAHKHFSLWTFVRRARLMHFVMLAGVLCCAVPPASRAHDLGVTNAEMTQVGDDLYVLVVQVPPNMSHLYGPPDIPERCDFVAQSAPGGLTRPVVRYEWRCGEALTAKDVLVFPWKREGVMLTVRWKDGGEVRGFFRRGPAGIEVPLGALRAGSGSLADAARRYTSVGVEHILLGIDHLLFVLGLLLLVSGAMRLVKTITAFTAAHSITLALATLGVVSVPSKPVDAVVALSIVFVAAEVLHKRRGYDGISVRHPWVVSFGFGLLHGLGFAGALSKLGLPQGEIPSALLFFNVGVEIGQLIFVAAFLAVVWALRVVEARFPRWSVPVPPYALGTVATYWFIQRALVVFGL